MPIFIGIKILAYFKQSHLKIEINMFSDKMWCRTLLSALITGIGLWKTYWGETFQIKYAPFYNAHTHTQEKHVTTKYQFSTCATCEEGSCRF